MGGYRVSRTEMIQIPLSSASEKIIDCQWVGFPEIRQGIVDIPLTIVMLPHGLAAENCSGLYFIWLCGEVFVDSKLLPGRR
jgi:hypothetical protein